MPLFLCPVDDFSGTWAYDEDLGVAYLRYVENGVIWFLVVGAEKRATYGRCAVPFVGLGSGLLSKIVCGLEVGNGVGGFGGIVGRGLDFKGPKVGYETGPESMRRSSWVSKSVPAWRILSEGYSRRVPFLSRSPCSYAIVCSDKTLAD